MQPHGPWKIVASHEVYRDPWISVRKDDVIRPDGKNGTYSYVHLKPGVCVVAVDDDGFIYLTEEFHYGVGRSTIEGVSGGIEPGEDALITAQRELKEEIGIDAEEWRDLGIVDPFTANVVSPTRLYLARGLHFGDHAPEGTELIRRVKMPLREAIDWVMEGRITHGPSGVLILKVALLQQDPGGLKTRPRA
jgi:ADP-ribose pyrophosphatase